MTDAKLIALGKRINAAMDRVDEERAHVTDLYAEAKGQGYIPKMLRKAIARQRMDSSKRQEEDSILDLYDHALGNVGKALEAISKGATWDEASATHGVNRRTLARAASVTKQSELSPQITSSPVASGVEGCGPRPRQPESVASLAGEAEAPAPISADGMDIPPFLRRTAERQST